MPGFKEIVVFIFTRTGLYFILAFAVIFKISNPLIASSHYLDLLSDKAMVPIEESKIQNRGNLRDVRLAIKYYDLLSSSFPQVWRAQELKAYSYFLLGEYQKAINVYKKLVSERSHLFWINYNIGVLYQLQNDQKQSQIYLQKVTDVEWDELKKAAILSPLKRAAPQRQNELFAMAEEFAQGIKLRAVQLLMGKNMQAYNEPLIHPWIYIIPLTQEFLIMQ